MKKKSLSKCDKALLEKDLQVMFVPFLAKKLKELIALHDKAVKEGATDLDFKTFIEQVAETLSQKEESITFKKKCAYIFNK